MCGEVSHAAVLCPSFYRTRIVQNPSLPERAWYGLRRLVLGAAQGVLAKRRARWAF
jgi:indolepyruvate ferredoxin oxidoreductase alpha subunit